MFRPGESWVILCCTARKVIPKIFPFRSLTGFAYLQFQTWDPHIQVRQIESNWCKNWCKKWCNNSAAVCRSARYWPWPVRKFGGSSIDVGGILCRIHAAGLARSEICPVRSRALHKYRGCWLYMIIFYIYIHIYIHTHVYIYIYILNWLTRPTAAPSSTSAFAPLWLTSPRHCPPLDGHAAAWYEIGPGMSYRHLTGDG